jgi:hypothetical protein
MLWNGFGAMTTRRNTVNLLKKIIDWIRSLFMIRYPSPGQPPASFEGGYNDSVDPSLVHPNQFVTGDNMRILDDGSADQRTGYSNLLASAETERILAKEQIEIGQTRYEIFATQSAIKLKSGTGTTTLYSGLNGIDYGLFHQWNDKLFFANSNDNIKKLSITNRSYIYSGRVRMNYDLGGVKTIGTSENHRISNSRYIYEYAGANTLRLDPDFNLINSVTQIGDCMCCNESNVFAFTGLGAINKYDLSLGLVSSSTFTLYPGFTCCNDTYLFHNRNDFGSSRTKTVDRYNAVTLAYIDTLTVASDITGIQCNSTHIFIFYNSTTMSVYTTSFVFVANYTLPITGLSGRYAAVNDDMILLPGSYNNIMYKYSTSMVLQKQISTPSLGFVPYLHIIKQNMTDWHDVCSPFRPILNILSSGSVTATSYYRSTWYNLDSGLETSGGLESTSVISSANNIEVFFDFNLDSQITKGKADAIDTSGVQTGLGVSHHRLYRKDGTANYLLQGTYPIYFTLDGSITDAVTACNIDDLKSMPLTQNFYVIVDEEIILVTAGSVTGTSWAVITRGQKGTTATLHDDASTMYLFSIIDDTATASLGTTICPIKNDFVPVAKYITDHKERLLLGNSSEYPSRFWYSSFNEFGNGDEDLILEDNYYDVHKDDGTTLNGITIHSDNLILGKNRSSSYFAGDMDTGSMLEFNNHLGIEAHKTIVNYQNGFFSLCRAGITYAYGQKVVNLTKSFIPNLIMNINWPYAYKSHGQYLEKYQELWMFVPTGTDTDCKTAYVLNTQLSDLTDENKPKCWYKFSFPSYITSSALIVDTNGDDKLWTATSNLSTTNQINLQDDTNADAGTTITSYIEKIHAGEPEYHKKYRRVITDMMGQSSNTNIVLGTDTGDGSYTNANINQNFAGRNPKITSLAAERGLFLRAKWTNANASVRMRIFGFRCDFKLHKVRG